MRQLLDKGYLEQIEAWGTGKEIAMRDVEIDGLLLRDFDYEVGIVEAARQSTQGSFRGWEEDQKLLGFLYSHHHDTPFEFAGLIVEVYAPISVFREWHRHRSASYNEASARYAPLPPDYYAPGLDRIFMREPGTNLQASAARDSDVLTYGAATIWRAKMLGAYAACEEAYQYGLAAGVPKELARQVMPVGHYSRMRAQMTLRHWLAFMTLRLDPTAQWEIRQYAWAIAEIIATTFPRTWELFRLGRGLDTAYRRVPESVFGAPPLFLGPDEDTTQGKLTPPPVT